jgi:hypothetical protein
VSATGGRDGPPRQCGRQPASVQCRLAFAHNSRRFFRFVTVPAVAHFCVPTAHGCTVLHLRRRGYCMNMSASNHGHRRPSVCR